jgi:hypothetical protein
MNVKSRKANVELPSEFARTEFTVSSGTNVNATIANKLGQSMATVSHKIRTPKKIPSTCIPEAVTPGMAGINRKNSMMSKETM